MQITFLLLFIFLKPIASHLPAITFRERNLQIYLLYQQPLVGMRYSPGCRGRTGSMVSHDR